MGRLFLTILSQIHEATYDLSDLVTGFDMVIADHTQVCSTIKQHFTDYDGPITTKQDFASVQRDIFVVLWFKWCTEI